MFPSHPSVKPEDCYRSVLVPSVPRLLLGVSSLLLLELLPWYSESSFDSSDECRTTTTGGSVAK